MSKCLKAPLRWKTLTCQLPLFGHHFPSSLDHRHGPEVSVGDTHEQGEETWPGGVGQDGGVCRVHTHNKQRDEDHPQAGEEEQAASRPVIRHCSQDLRHRMEDGGWVGGQWWRGLNPLQLYHQVIRLKLQTFFSEYQTFFCSSSQSHVLTSCVYHSNKSKHRRHHFVTLYFLIFLKTFLISQLPSFSFPVSCLISRLIAFPFISTKSETCRKD